MDPYARAFDGSVREPRERAGPRQRRRHRRARAAHSWSSTTPSTGATTTRAPATRAGTDTVVYEVHVTRRDDAAPPGAQRRCAGPTSASAHDAFLSHLVALGVTTVELLPVHECRRRGLPRRRRAHQLLGLQPDRVLRARARATPRPTRSPAPQVDEFKAMVARAAPRGSRGRARRRLQPHRRGRRDGTDALACGGSTRRRTTATTTRTASSTRRAAATRSTRRAPRRSALVARLAALLGVEPATSTASASTSPRRSRAPDGAFDPAAPILAALRARPGPAARSSSICEPWDVGVRRQLRARAVPCAVPRVERRASATRCGTSGAATRARSARSRRASPARRTCSRHRSARHVVGQLRDLPRRLHAARPRRRTTRSTTRPTARGTPTAPTTTVRGTAAWRARPTSQRSSRCAPGSAGRCSRRCS